MRLRTTTPARGNAVESPTIRPATDPTTRAAARAERRADRRKSPLALTVALAVVAAIGIPVATASTALAATTPSPSPSDAAAALQVQRSVDQDAAFYVSAARAVRQSAVGKVDTSLLDLQISNLDNSAALPESSVSALTRLVRTSAGDLVAAVAAYNARVAAEAAAAQAAADAAAAAAAEALAAANTPDGARATARAMAASQYGWGDDQFSCLNSLWQKESGWNYEAYNPSGATGIPQALPGSKMASSGSDWATNATTQIAWGLGYISAVYGAPCSAWGHSQSVNWY
ncbi:phospholipase [Microbacterium sp. P01]|uniref:aggregation-promoting factor C-terminal-like domain-containing protein n=1 Tax=Microbacterium sp. P01 TaxID=3366261 RepID=UPI00366DC555